MSMALTRPPGHHATFSLQNGFCLYNFAGATAIHCVKYLGLKKVRCVNIIILIIFVFVVTIIIIIIIIIICEIFRC